MGSFTKRLTRFSLRRDEKDAESFPAKECCHDCAFRPDSPERRDPEAWAQLLAQTDPANAIRPFYCHIKHDGREMPVGPNGEYDPPLHPDGRPKGYPMCAGWAKTFKVRRGKA